MEQIIPNIKVKDIPRCVMCGHLASWIDLKTNEALCADHVENNEIIYRRRGQRGRYKEIDLNALLTEENLKGGEK